MVRSPLLLCAFVVVCAVSCLPLQNALASTVECSPSLKSSNDGLDMFMRPAKCQRIANDEKDPDCHCIPAGKRVFWPYTVDEIRDLVSTKQYPVHIARNDPNCFGSLFSSAEFFRLITFYRFKYENNLSLVRDGITVMRHPIIRAPL